MKYTIEEHEARLQAVERNSGPQDYYADLLAEVKRLQEGIRQIQNFRSDWDKVQQERDSLEARLADAVETMKKCLDYDNYIADDDTLMQECLARISGGGK